MTPRYPTDLLPQLSIRHLAILDDLERFRLLSTRHIQLLHFPVQPGHHATRGGATKSAMRGLLHLEGLGLIVRLGRQIGGVRHGSQGYLWQLTSAGATLQRSRGHQTQRRYQEPALGFIEHTLAVADLAVTLRTLAWKGQLELRELEAEPACWRPLLAPHGGTETLKPDLYSATATDKWKDFLFWEVDRATEHLPQVLAKCRAYARYQATGVEQEKHRVFPAVVWVAPTEARAQQLRSAIRGEKNLPQKLFQVITNGQVASQLLGQPPP